MLARRIIAVSPDRAFGQQLAAALEAVSGTVDVHASLGTGGAGDAGGAGGQAALCVIHLEGELARAPGELLAHLPEGCPVIAVLPRSSLAAAVALMQGSDRIAAMMVAEDFDPGQLSAMAARIVADDIFGLEKVMPAGTQIYAQLVGDYREKSLCMAAIAEFIERASVPRRYRAPIEQCIDEMLMNALYDAPVDAQGNHIFAGVPTKIRITQRTQQRVVVQYACDGKRFAVSVRDAFGTLDRQTVLRYLHKSLHSEQQVDRKAGGAGLGLYLMCSSSTAVSFNVLPGFATEAICLFDLEAPKQQLAQLGFLVQHDQVGWTAAGPARRLSAGPRLRVRPRYVVAGAVLVVAGMGIGIQARSRRAAGAGEGAADAQAVATVELDSQPTGAGVEIDGQPMGSTPLTLTQLAPGATVAIVFKRAGYRAATARLGVPAVGDRKRLVQPLELSDEFVRVRFVSSPPGAVVTRTGEPPAVDRTYTPAEMFVEVGKVQRFTLTMPRHVPLVIEPFTPERGAQGLEKGGALTPGASLRVEAARGGKVTVLGAPHCKDVAVPADCTVAPGTYIIEYLGPDGAEVTRTVTMGTEDAIEKL